MSIFVSTSFMIDRDMTSKDKDAVDKVKAILKECSPDARREIQALFQPSIKFNTPRSMDINDVKIPPAPQKLVRADPRIPVDDDNADWLKQWIK
jgi:hypothetical protein